MLFTLILSCMIAGLLACSDDNRCTDDALTRDLMSISFLPNEEELKYFCPKVKTFLECEKEFLECPGQSLEELAASSDKVTTTKPKALLGFISLVNDLCDEDSSLHTDYIASASCLREHFDTSARNCREEIAKPVQDFIDHIHAGTEVEDSPEDALVETRCLKFAYEVVCIIGKVDDNCGSVAQRTIRNGFERFKGVLGSGFCYGLENTADLMSRFVDYLELDEPSRTRAQGIFDILKRRR